MLGAGKNGLQLARILLSSKRSTGGGGVGLEEGDGAELFLLELPFSRRSHRGALVSQYTCRMALACFKTTPKRSESCVLHDTHGLLPFTRTDQNRSKVILCSVLLVYYISNNLSSSKFR